MGESSSLTQPAGLSPDLLFELRYNETSVQLIVVNSLPGDFNRDGLVDTADFVIFEKSAGQSVAPYSSADANGDTLINSDDYNIWRAHFGTSIPGPGSGASANVPEPPAILVLVLTGFVFATRPVNPVFEHR
jgi:hypothetical protein